jgi:hypothetical protein
MLEMLHYVKRQLEEYICPVHKQAPAITADPERKLVIATCCLDFKQHLHAQMNSHVNNYYEKEIKNYFGNPGQE